MNIGTRLIFDVCTPHRIIALHHNLARHGNDSFIYNTRRLLRYQHFSLAAAHLPFADINSKYLK